MTESPATRPGWRLGPLRLWLRPHTPGQSGERQARPLLAHWLHCAEDALPLVRDERGRPRLLAPLQAHDIGWAHSGQILLLATGRDVELGVDLERLRPRPRAMELAERFFHPDEAGALAALPQEQRELAFLQLWCAKEAVLKAHGHGISFGLEKLVFAQREGHLHLIACDPDLGRAQDWQLRHWVPAPGYLAAAAWRSR